MENEELPATFSLIAKALGSLKICVFPIIAPQLSDHIAYSTPNHGIYTIRGAIVSWRRGFNGFKDSEILLCNNSEFAPVCAPSLVGAYYLQTQTHAPYFYIMIYYVMARSWGCITYWGTNGKDPILEKQFLWRFPLWRMEILSTSRQLAGSAYVPPPSHSIRTHNEASFLLAEQKKLGRNSLFWDLSNRE